MRNIEKAGFATLFIAAGLALSSTSHADLLGSPFKLEASSSLGTAAFEASLNDFTYDPITDAWSWSLEAPVEMRATSGELIATLGSAGGYYQQDPIVGLFFSAQAGAVTTHFTITSALLSFSNINPAEGQASAGLTVTDFDGDGANLTGQYAANKAYRAFYNGFLTNVFASLDDPIAAGAGGSNTVSESFGFAPNGSVNDMSTQFDFNLSAFDFAGGTSRYEVRLAVPEPATLFALALGIGALAARRRRKA